jgi:uncharacterized ion transporter superfamily protein YfcC
MAPRTRWLLRDLPRTYVVLVCAAFVVSVLAYFVDWSQFRRETAAKPQLDNAANQTDEQRYTGSIIVPTSKDLCLELTLDNRNGNMKDNGYVNCGTALSKFENKNPHEGMDVLRMRAVSKAFQN